MRVDSIMTLDSTAHCWSILKDSLGFAMHKDIKKFSQLELTFHEGQNVLQSTISVQQRVNLICPL